jgi:hypothetical protein
MGTALAIQSYRRVDLSGLAYAPMIKDTSARLYVVPIDPPLRIQTTPVALATSLEDPEVPFVYLSPDASLAAFFKKTEQAIEDACVANKTAWFAAKFEDDLLRRGFKSFFGDAGFKVKVPSDVACFDSQQKPIGREDVPAGSVVRAVLELSRVCFGRHEYGATWKLIQLQVVETKCLIQAEEVQPPAEADDDADSDANEFL